MNAHPIFLSFLSLSPVNSLPNFSSPFLHYPFFLFIVHSHGLSLALNRALFFTSFQSVAFFTVVPSSLLLEFSTILQSNSHTLCTWRIQKTFSCISTSELQHQFDTLQNVSMFFSEGPKNVQKHILNHWFGENISMMRSSQAWPKQANTLYRIYGLSKSAF